jgi:hypothetical protein
VAAAPEVPAVPDDVVYGTGQIDKSGRVADRAITIALGWQPGDRLTLTAAAGALRRRFGLRPGDRVLLAVFPARDAVGDGGSYWLNPAR